MVSFDLNLNILNSIQRPHMKVFFKYTFVKRHTILKDIKEINMVYDYLALFAKKTTTS